MNASTPERASSLAARRARRDGPLDKQCSAGSLRTHFPKEDHTLMANTKSAAKRARQNEGRADANKRVTTTVKTQLRLIRAAVTAGKKSEALALIPKVSSALDKAAKTGRIHRNKANRHKGDLARQLAALK